MYFNGFAVAMGSSDFSLRLRVDNVDFIECKASYTTIKTLAEKLSFAVKSFEELTNHPLMTTEDVNKALAKSDLKTSENA